MPKKPTRLYSICKRRPLISESVHLLCMSTIAREAHCAVSSARLAVHSLEDKQLVSISPDFRDAPGGGKWHGANYYRVLELPSYVRRDAAAGALPGRGSKKNHLNNMESEDAVENELPF